MTEREEWIWLAGILEGEGYFGVGNSAWYTSTGRRPKLVVALKMCDRDVVERAAVLMQTHVGKPLKPSTEQGRIPWRAVVYSAKAERVMRHVHSYMGLRRSAKIEKLLAMKGLSHHKAN